MVKIENNKVNSAIAKINNFDTDTASYRSTQMLILKKNANFSKELFDRLGGQRKVTTSNSIG